MDMNKESTMNMNEHVAFQSAAGNETRLTPAASPLYRRILDRFYTGCFAVSMIALGLMGIAVLVQIGGRLMSMNVPSVPEIAGFCMAASSFLGLAHTFREGGHVRVSLLLAGVSSKWRLGFERFALAIALLLAVMFAFYLVEMTIESFMYGDASDGVIAIPLWIPQAFVSAGVIALAIAVADVLVDALRGNMPGYVNKEALPH